jgi:hypothetical protein
MQVMRLPAFNPSGDLPEGVHPATLGEVMARFGVAPSQRIAVASRLERIHRVATSTGHVGRFVVFGSFITDKAEPNDVDVFLLMEDAFDASTLAGEARMLFDHPAAQT